MHRLARRTVLAGATALALASGLPALAASEKVTFALNWFPVGDHAAYYVALDKGYFSERGLDVSLENSKGSGDVINKIGTGRAEIGLADSSAVIAALARGAEIKIIGMVFDKTPLNVFSRKDNPITEPKQLEGKSIGAPPGDGQRQIWPAFAKLTGIDAGKVTWVNVEPTAKFAALSEKRVDAVGDYTTGLPYYEKALGKGNVVMMPWANFGLDMYSMSIITSDKMVKEKPKVVRALLEAAYMGWRDVMADPKTALAIYKKRVPEIDVAFIEPNMMLGLDLLRTKRYAEHGIGWIEPEKMCHSVDLVNTYMGLPKKVDCKTAYTEALLPKIEPPPGFVH
jgi:NitT/TauT family transport system substrate-binding protein